MFAIGGFIRDGLGVEGERKWNLIPLLLSAVLAVVLCIDNIAFDIVSFKVGKSATYNLLFWFFGFLALVILPLFAVWKKQRIHERVLLLTLSALFIAINYKFRLAVQFSVVFALGVSLYYFRERRIYRPHVFYILLFVYGLLNTVSLLWTSNLELGLWHLWDLLPLMFMPLFFCFLRLEKPQFDLIALFVCRAMMLYVAYSICSWAIEMRFLGYSLQEVLKPGKDMIEGIYPYDAVYGWTNQSHPTYNALCQLFALSVCWFYVGQQGVRDRTTFFELLFLIGATFLIAMLTGSRFMFVGWIVVNFLGGCRWLGASNKLSISLFGLTLLVVVYFLSDKVASFIADPIRILLYRAAFEAIELNTWHGTGLGGMADYIHVYEHIHPHNQFVGDLMQTGLFGILSILSIVICLAYSAFVQHNWLLGLNLLIFLILSCIEMPLLYSPGIFFFSLVFCFLVLYNGKAGTMLDR